MLQNVFEIWRGIGSRFGIFPIKQSGGEFYGGIESKQANLVAHNFETDPNLKKTGYYRETHHLL